MRTAVAVCLMAFAASASLARAQWPYREPARVKISKDAGASCEQPPGHKSPQSEIVRSPVLASPGGVFLAYSENEAIAFGRAPNGSPPDYECENTARIYVAGPKNDHFVPVIVQTATRGSLDNYLDLVDWSPGGRYLLSNLYIAAYGTDEASHYVLLFDARYGVLWPRLFVYRALDRHFGKKCDAILDPLGFSADGKIVLGISRPYDMVGNLDPDACTKKDAVWLLDAASKRLTQAPNGFKVVHFGRWLSTPETRENPSQKK